MEKQNDTLWPVSIEEVQKMLEVKSLALEKLQSELEIETALERVRAVAMSMKKSEDLFDVCEVMYKELTALNFTNIRNVQIAINLDEYKSWLIFEYSKYGEIKMKKVDSSISPLLKEIAEEMSATKDAHRLFQKQIKGEEFKKWREWRVKADALKDPRVEKANSMCFYLHGIEAGILGISSFDAISNEQVEILSRFKNAFDLSYRRYADVAKAEAQAREAQIEAALERVRAKVMAMNSSKDLNETSLVFGEQLRKLGIDWQFSYFWLIEEDKDDNTFWITWPDNKTSTTTYSLAEADESFRECIIAWRNQTKIHSTQVPVQDVQAWLDTFERVTADAGGAAFEVMKPGNFKEGVYYYDAMIRYGSFGILINRSINDEEKNIQIRFATEFERAYQRFLDLQKAEARTREARIEAALEKVRSRSLAMHKSDELQEVVNTLFEKLQELDIEADSANIAIFKEGTRDYDYWVASHFQKRAASFHMPYTELLLTRDLIAARESGTDFSAKAYSFEEKNEWFNYAFKNTDFKFLSEERKQFILDSKGISVSIAFAKNTGVQIVNYSGNLLSENEADILKRFSRVFEQAYTRFLDLQKAEAQAREARIEMALEKIRSRTMAMQHSDELPEAANLLFLEVQALGIPAWSCGYNVLAEDKKTSDCWMSSEGAIQAPFTLYFTEEASFIEWYDFLQSGETFFVQELGGKELENHYNYMRNIPKLGEVLKKLEDAGILLPTYQINHLCKFASGFLLFITYESVPDAHDLFKRFTKVFEQTYTRFLDLQKAEAQSREAQIELGLERVRARAMAMQTSEELNALIGTVFTELTKLDLVLTRCVILIYEGKEKGVRWWMANSEAPSMPMSFFVKYADLPFFNAYLKGWKDRSLKWQYVLEGENKIKTDDFLFNETELSQLPDFVIAGMRAPDRVYLNASFNNFGNLTLASIEPLSDEHFDILLRFAKVFDLTYTRFNDLQKAEAQARESQIQLAMERVRARTMAMQHSDELKDAAALLFQQVKSLGVPAYSCGYNIWEKNETTFTSWMSTQDGSDFNAVQNIPLTEDANFIRYVESKQKGEPFFVLELRGERMQEHYKYLKTIPAFKGYFDYAISVGFDLPQIQIHHIANFSQGNLLFITLEPCLEFHDVFKRFAAVFEQTYTRFLDLQKAEAQAREARIEAILERIRSRTMAMQKSDELTDVAGLLFKQVTDMGVKTWTAGFNVWSDDNNSYIDYITSPNGGFIEPYTVLTDTAEALTDISNARKSGVEFDVQYVEGEKIKQLYLALTKLDEKQYEIMLQDGIRFPSHQYEHFVFGSKVSLMFITYEPVPEAHDIFKRLGKVFEQTYTRFLDLQKAEAQARESQIQLALERVRARTMAMHKSHELREVVAVVFQQMQQLGFQLNLCNIILFDKTSLEADYWVSFNEQAVLPQNYHIPYSNHPFYQYQLNAWKNAASFSVFELAGEMKISWDEILFTQTDIKKLPASLGEMMQNLDKVMLSSTATKHGLLQVIGHEPLSNEYAAVLTRFAKVFEQTYTRFLDLQKVEEQAREATIEAAMEKVRGKAMAMHNSNDLSVTTSMVFTELRKLGIKPIRCGVGLLSKESRKGQLYSATSSADGDSLSLVGWVMLSGHPVLENIYDTWLKNEEYYPELSGEQLKSYYENLLSGLSLPTVPDWQSEKKQYGTFLSFSVGCLYAWSEIPYNDAEIKILKRFAAIIDLTFRRYIELQKSEASAKEAIKQSALDRIRADIASMRTTNDLERITPLIWNELTVLGVPFIRCGIFIMDDSQELIHTFLSTPEGKAIAAFHLPYTTPGNIGKILSHWRDKNVYIDRWDESAFTQFADILVKQGALASAEQYLTTIPLGGFYLHFFPFLQGMLYVGNTISLGEDEVKLVQSIADAFSTAYARYEDFNKLESAKQQVEKTLVDLEQAQTQLIQSEKMASLGELTAGIAHEIQNPLNFVNNFSEVNAELIEELKNELKSGKNDEAILIADDIRDNEQKINHHGKRADAIVKGMLQHSRISTGQKELTNINTLADEYLRLAYHGMRAKDNFFNVNIKTDFDESIEKIKIIPQDIGRVILNLITNAFYAVNEKKKQQPDSYEPTVTVSTKRLEGKVEIRVEDNGNGIPQKVLDKIFQPFFTTKPTGQGTGLGLSLSYDIVKAHGGEIKVETKEGEWTEFIVSLPG
jgi:signal transduction histidine kinase